MDKVSFAKELQEIGSALEAVGERLFALQGQLMEAEEVAAQRPILFGARVSAQFRAGVLWIEEKIGLNADHLMACMAFETGQTFSPKIRNLAGSSGTGLIQFMAATAKGLGTTTAALAKLSDVQQLSYVYRYFRQFGSDFSDWTLEDTYMAILFPKAIGKPLDWQMPWQYGSLAYKQNSGLDLDKDRVITKAEASAGVRRMAKIGAELRA
jgi:hypothetical protein